MELKRTYKYLDIITTAFVVILLVSNLIGSLKVTRLCIAPDLCFSFTTGLFLFPASYLIGDILTEVYGYSKSRKVIWSGFAALILSNLLIQFFKILPPDPNWGLQEAYSQIFNQSLRVSAASMLAFFCGEFTNSFVIAKLKVITKGKFQFLRIIGSTIAGELVDSVIIYPLAFLGAPGFTPALVLKIMITNYCLKVLWEILVYPLTKILLKFLKKVESEDYYDYETDFNPFHA
ncbi:MAG: queuosine precursor transporter [Candidatus Caenarcaniphilales bacterium]|nr:queuosine precursor transporter [Candidatus Caenarcaniphilales bacterium]